MALTERLASWLLAEDAGTARERERLREALFELEADRPERARRLALRVLDDTPRSRAALAVWAEASEAMGLDEEAETALGRLARALPERADLWWRLSCSQQRLDRGGAIPAERAVRAMSPRPAALAAARWLFRKALDERDVGAAQRLARHLEFGFEVLENTHLDLAELDLDQGRLEQARRRLENGSLPALLDARGWLVRARAAADSADALRYLVRAVLLGEPKVLGRAGEFVCERTELAVGALPVAAEMGFGGLPEWQLAKALAAADPRAKVALCASQAELTPLPSIALCWLRAVLPSRDPLDLDQALRFARTQPSLDRHPLRLELDRLLEASTESDSERRLTLLDAPMYFAASWASEERERVYEGWLSQGAWSKLLRTLRPQKAEPTVDELLARLGQLREEPLELVLAGEFNAGKSSLVNALAGAELAEVGVTPTTHRSNRYAWNGLWLIDTPGFNAPGHADGEEAFAALEGGHAALWVMDGSSPFRDSEARRLAALQRAGVPFWLLVNKCDRIPPLEAGALRAHVAQGLAHAGVEPIDSPSFVSTRNDTSLEPFSQRLASWCVEHETVLRQGACLRTLRHFVGRADVPSTAKPKQAGRRPPGASRDAPFELRLRAFSRVLERAENSLKR